jgi:D-alanyl-lipoteichoic acid acyltransferase DltB (MBOAT superfamily)
MITMLLGGLWHGAAWTFVLWGAYQGVLLSLYRWMAGRRAGQRWLLGGSGAARVLGWCLMFHLTCYGWLIFRATSATQIAALTSSVLTNFAPASVQIQALLVPLVLYVTPLILVHASEAWFDDVLIVRRFPVGVRYSVYAATFYLILLFGNFGGADFIYFQF